MRRRFERESDPSELRPEFRRRPHVDPPEAPGPSWWFWALVGGCLLALAGMGWWAWQVLGQ